MMTSSHTVYVYNAVGGGGEGGGVFNIRTENNSHSSDNSAKPKVRCTCFLRRNNICSYESCPKSKIQVN